MSFTYSFEKLEVWKLSRQLNVRIYQLSGNFPDSEKFGLVNQIRRAVISVCSNIAEGASKPTFKDQARYTQLSYNSLMEVLNDLILANDLGFIDDKKLRETRDKIETLSNKLNSYRNYQLSRHRIDNRKPKNNKVGSTNTRINK